MAHDPQAEFSFLVRIAGTTADIGQGFQEVSGLSPEYSMTLLEEAGENRLVHNLPGNIKAEHLVLKRGMVLVGSPLFVWFKTTLEADLANPITPRSLTVSLLDAKRTPMMTWSVVDAWPVKWSVDAFDATGNALAIETMAFAYQRLERKINPSQ